MVKKQCNSLRLAFILPQDLWLLHNFILLTATRTNAAKKEGETTANIILDMIKPSLAQREEAKARGITQEAIDGCKLVLKTANHYSMRNAMVATPLISDLNMALLVNRTKRPFITSDSPVIFYNFLKFGDLSLVGWQSPGLIIFLPLNGEVTLWLFDPQMYTQKANAKSIIDLSKKSDVDELNKLQVLNADEILILPGPYHHQYVLSLHNSLERRRAKLVSMDTFSEFDVRDEHHEIHRISRREIDYNPHLSFLRVDKSYIKDCRNAYKEKATGLESDRPFVFIRSEELCALVDSEIKQLKTSMESALSPS
jgi:hypothetical protein